MISSVRDHAAAEELAVQQDREDQAEQHAEKHDATTVSTTVLTTRGAQPGVGEHR